MPEQLTIVCPHCAFSKTVPKNTIPEGARQATCPGCKKKFPLNSETVKAQVSPPSISGGMASAPQQPSAAGVGSAPPTRPPTPSPRSGPSTLGFSFNGSARDYFGIWIVNTLLKIVTVGIYSAWAKVRKRRFFYGSPPLHNQPFESHADPMALFKGWVIAALAFILYSIATRVSPVLSGVIALLVFLAFPWLLVRSRIFNAVNSSYRNIRFGFRPDYRQAYVVFAALPIISMLTLGLLMPYMLYRQKKYVAENSSYGATPFSFNATVKDFYIISFKVALGFIAVFGLIGIILGMTGNNLASASGGIEALRGLAIIPVVTLPLVYFLLMVYAQTAMTNLSWNGTCLGGGRFRSTLRTRDMALLFVTNGLAIMFSLGLMVPWATVRLARYRFERLELVTSGGLDNVVAAAGCGSVVGATGEEIGDLFDMPVDIAF